MIEECVVGYRTVGQLNDDGSNAVLLSTWGFGTSGQKLASDAYVGPDGWVDPEKYLVIVVDAFGNGVSSSPSNSRTPRGAAFPGFTFRDIVRAQYRSGRLWRGPGPTATSRRAKRLRCTHGG